MVPRGWLVALSRNPPRRFQELKSVALTVESRDSAGSTAGALRVEWGNSPTGRAVLRFDRGVRLLRANCRSLGLTGTWASDYRSPVAGPWRGGG
jgi:hypothetical protein